ncbi:WGR domain-containing protein [Methylobacterium sp. 092160098-2]|uniref:WGR domain-containing protein n=1 Tax=Methylobacterium sp. 092160098-2 TaxID=3025129 RepID=UPI002381B6E1|nr:WGR domain-containing protein [Methylobacterium sp. 092160098-2]MDE4913941.1 WGR domain-containing protein [Methylobacterium sp. 092160098-2]
MQRYELTAGSSAKFWEAGTEDSVLIVRFGRLGTQGQSKTKSFASAQAARVELDRLVREKTAKGYRPAGDAAPASAAGATAQATVAQATVARAADSRNRRGFAGPRRPGGGALHPGNRRRPDLLRHAPATRTRPGPPLDAAADWAAFAARIRPLLETAPDEARAPAEALAARLDGAPPAPDHAEARHWLEQLEAACPALNQRLWGAKPGPQGPAARAAFTHFARWLVARSGTGTLVALFDRLPAPPLRPVRLPAGLGLGHAHRLRHPGRPGRRPRGGIRGGPGGSPPARRRSRSRPSPAGSRRSSRMTGPAPTMPSAPRGARALRPAGSQGLRRTPRRPAADRRPAAEPGRAPGTPRRSTGRPWRPAMSGPRRPPPR